MGPHMIDKMRETDNVSLVRNCNLGSYWRSLNKAMKHTLPAQGSFLAGWLRKLLDSVPCHTFYQTNECMRIIVSSSSHLAFDCKKTSDGRHVHFFRCIEQLKPHRRFCSQRPSLVTPSQLFRRTKLVLLKLLWLLISKLCYSLFPRRLHALGLPVSITLQHNLQTPALPPS